MKKNTVYYAFKTSLPIMAGYIVLGFGFGALLTSKNIPWFFGALMSIFVYAGSMQYAAVDLISSSASLLTFGIMTLAINIRHIFYGLSMINKYHDTGKAKPYLALSLTDETFSLLCNIDPPENVNKTSFYVLVSAFNQMYWLIGTVLGTTVSTIFNLQANGIEFSMTAIFFVTAIEQWEKNKNHISALIGLAVSIVTLIIFGPDSFLIPALLGITCLLLICKRWIHD